MMLVIVFEQIFLFYLSVKLNADPFLLEISLKIANWQPAASIFSILFKRIQDRTKSKLKKRLNE